MSSYLIPLPGGKDIALDGPFPLDQRDWEAFMTVLAAMKPGLTDQEASS